ncbi:DUF4134 domain-containing protein [Paraflavisolibacter sp. H34]|uniref:DUF4134 domain-containing protein n=1 Tax=Huijunlia imazamoxiresistens TaxID=3127457 RepID=UPI00301B283D
MVLNSFPSTRKAALVLLALMLTCPCLYAGNGAAGINAGAAEIKSYFDPVSNLTLAIGAVVGLVGGIVIYVKWNGGDHNIARDVMGWGGALVFLILVAVVVKAFFL